MKRRCWVLKGNRYLPAARLEADFGLSLVRVRIDGFALSELVAQMDIRDNDPYAPEGADSV